MAETLISPGVLASENDNSFISQGPITVGAAIIGPTVKGPYEIPTIVTSYSDYQSKFGTTFNSGGQAYTYFTSIAAYNYFNNGGGKTIKAGYASNIGMSPSTGDIYIGNFNGSTSTTDYGAIAGYQNCMYIKQNGNIGIGTTNPTYKLAVKGTIRTNEVIVETGWADYVFEKDYKLPSLREVDQYIKNNKHLPEIPSAQEIQNNGLSVGEIQTKMMQKIEELTLYVIELQKQIDELKKNNNSRQ